MPLKPADVGQRVVVRSLVRGETGPSGGPALTDTLGRLERWDSDELSVRKADGTLVRIPLADVVAGKPVPARASRHTPRGADPAARISAEELERICSEGWPPAISGVLGEWRLRAAGGFTGRANSALVAGDPGVPFDSALEVVNAFYAGHGLPALAQVVLGTGEERALRDRGWSDARPGQGDVLVQVATVTDARRRGTGAVHEVELSGHADAAWISRYARAGSADPEVVRALLEGANEVRFARIGTPPVAIGRAAISRDWVGLAAVEVEPGWRGQGLARAVVESLLSWAAERGATAAYLQTLADNDAALGLYASYGFTTHHRYRYLAPPR
jgi:GNAT superfamily N-acetyltransferase